MSTRKYILNGHLPWRVVDLMAWAKWYETADRRVAFTPQSPPGGNISGNVSTVFLSLEPLGDEGKDPPLLFVTMVTGGPWDGFRKLVATWEEAEAQHLEVVKSIQAGLPAGEFVPV